jgi:PEP-CTERM motif
MKSSSLLSVIILLFVLAMALPSAAATADMQFTGLPTGNNYFAVPSYPYDVTVNGGPDRWMMCLGYNEHINGGETWKATVASVGSLDLSTHLLDYEAAFLFKMAVADHGADSDLNAAAWWLFEGSPSLTPGAQFLVTLAQSQSYQQGEFSDVTLYTAIPGTENSNLGTAQDFLSTTPEPGTLVLVGSGMIGMAGLLRRKFTA